MFRKITLKNGLRIIVVPQKNTPSMTVLVLVKTGSKYEKKEINGISHFLEHMFFKGTRKRPTSTEIAETLDRVGGIYNAFTSEESTGYFAKVASMHMELALDWVSDIFLNSTLPAKEIAKEKGVVIEEINMRYDHPASYVGVLWTRLLYGDQPAGWDVAGTKETVTDIDRQKLLDYRQNQYVAQNTIVCLAGNIQGSKSLNKVKKYFSKIKTGEIREKLKVVERQTKPALFLFRKKTDQTHICLGVRAYDIFHPQKYSQELLATILGGMMSSRLFIRVREQLGIAYHIRTSAETNPDSGFLVTQAGIDNKKVEKGISAILQEYKRISRIKVPFSELKKAKDHLKGIMALTLESSDAQASFYGFQELLEKEILTPKELFKKIDKVSQNDILKTAKDIFKPEKLNLALIGPFSDKKKFQELLKL